MHRRDSLWILIAALSLLALTGRCSAPPNAPPVLRNSLTLALADTFCTEAYLALSLTDAQAPRRVVITRNNQPVFSGELPALDTTFADTGLLPNTTYRYQAFRLNGNTRIDSSGELLVRTMDTTSHNWTWTTQTFGDFGSSTLYDVAIVHDSLAYAVGQIYLRDSLGQNDPIPYTIAIWNGQRWSFRKTVYNNAQPIVDIRGIWVASPTEIWLAAGSILLWDGRSSQTSLVFSRLSLPDPRAGVDKIWGNARNNAYAVGNAGTILHYNGGSWQRVESGTTLDLYDVYGSGNEVLAVAGNTGTSFERAIIRLSSTTAQLISSSPIQRSLTGIWFRTNKVYVTVGDGIFTKKTLNDPLWKPDFYTPYFTSQVRGTAFNDVWLAGGVGELLHFNGMTWLSYRTLLGISGNHFGLAVTQTRCLSVGFTGRQAFIATGD
jgi:hypothetical protein